MIQFNRLTWSTNRPCVSCKSRHLAVFPCSCCSCYLCSFETRANLEPSTRLTQGRGCGPVLIFLLLPHPHPLALDSTFTVPFFAHVGGSNWKQEGLVTHLVCGGKSAGWIYRHNFRCKCAGLRQNDRINPNAGHSSTLYSTRQCQFVYPEYGYVTQLYDRGTHHTVSHACLYCLFLVLIYIVCEVFLFVLLQLMHFILCFSFLCTRVGFYVEIWTWMTAFRCPKQKNWASFPRTTEQKVGQNAYHFHKLLHTIHSKLLVVALLATFLAVDANHWSRVSPASHSGSAEEISGCPSRYEKPNRTHVHWWHYARNYLQKYTNTMSLLDNFSGH